MLDAYFMVRDATIIKNSATLLALTAVYTTEDNYGSRGFTRTSVLSGYIGGDGNLLIPYATPRQGTGQNLIHAELEEAGLAFRCPVAYATYLSISIIATLAGADLQFIQAQATGDWKPFFNALSHSLRLIGWRSFGRPSELDYWTLAVALSDKGMNALSKGVHVLSDDGLYLFTVVKEGQTEDQLKTNRILTQNA